MTTDKSSGEEFICGRAVDEIAAGGSYLRRRDYIVRLSIRPCGVAGQMRMENIKGRVTRESTMRTGTAHGSHSNQGKASGMKLGRKKTESFGQKHGSGATRKFRRSPVRCE